MEIALNKESKRKTPAILAFRNGDRVFGEDAQTIGLRFPDKSYGYIIDLLGKTIDNPLVALYKYVFRSMLLLEIVCNYLYGSSDNAFPTTT